MMKGWLTKAGPYKVVHMPCPRPGQPVDTLAPPAGVLHTIEGSLDSGLCVFRKEYAPHFAVGAGRIVQMVPLGEMAAALEHPAGTQATNGLARVQIELEGHSKTTRWKPDAKTLDTLAALLAVLERADVAGIPLTRPFGDEMPPPPWATRDFYRRKAGLWGRREGWYGHVEIPNNSHWDPGALAWGDLIRLARKKESVYAAKAKPRKLSVIAQRARLRAYLLRQRASGATWATLRRSAQWKRWKALGGR